MKEIGPLPSEAAGRFFSGQRIPDVGWIEDEAGNRAFTPLTFACGGGECLLAKIATPGTEAARTIGKSAVEKHLHHTMGVASMISVKLSAR